ncbi:MAG: hypothetical protein ACPL0C_05630 [Candidatus Bathyarchaeales archaeon]
MDRFPEAFRRFEEVVKVEKIKSFQELLTSFSLWAGRKWKNTPKQVEALKVEAFKRQIPQIPVSFEEYEAEKAEIDKLYRRVYYCRTRYLYNEAVFKALTLERFRVRGKRRVELEKRISEAQKRMEFWKAEWESAYARLKASRSRFRLKVVAERRIRD